MAFDVFDRVKIKAGAKVYSDAVPFGRVVTVPFEVQVHRVLSADLSPEGFGEVLSWRSPGRLKDKDQLWVSASDAILVQGHENTEYP